MTAIEVFTDQLEPLLGWQSIADSKSMPSPLAKRLRALNVQVDQIAVNKQELTDQLKLIKDTYDVVNNLPVYLEDLKQTQVKLDKANEQASTLLDKIKSRDTESDTNLSSIRTKEEEAQQLIAKCEEAYRITTTKGLAAAFDLRADSLGRSMLFWVAGLVLALGLGSVVASKSFDSMIKVLSAPTISWAVVLLNMIIAVLSVGAPAWFAWVATKQIGQRFRLAEDYAFKASVAKAYEGYKKEAVTLDTEFASRLFSSALTRLEEAPLRLVEDETHGSPWHEFFNSKAFNKALDRVPEPGGLLDKILDRIPTIEIKRRRTAVEAAAAEAEKVVADAAEK